VSRARVWSLCVLGLASCADHDVTTLGSGALSPESPESGAPASETLRLLGEPDTVDVACRLIGVAAANLASAGPEAINECEAVVADCQDTLAGAGAAADVAVPDANVGALLGCELTATQLDACLADVLANARDAYASSLSCSTPSAAGLDALGLVASPACFIVALRCPQLLGSLAGLGTR